MNKLAIVGIFFDGYYDIWEDFLELFSQNWSDCPYPIYIVNGEAELSFNRKYNVSVLHAGSDAEYSRKVQTAISEIDAEYYLLLLEDFLLERPVGRDPLSPVIDLIYNNNISYLRMTLPEFLAGINLRRYKKDPESGFCFIPSNDEYTVTCQPSIWKKDFLKKCIGSGNYNAWVFEGMYSYSKKAHSEDFLSKCRVDFSNPLGLRHGAVQGKILPNVYNDLKSVGYEFKTHREVLGKDMYQKHLKKQKLKRLIPQNMQSAVKKFIRTDSVVDRYKDQILEQMKEIGLE